MITKIFLDYGMTLIFFTQLNFCCFEKWFLNQITNYFFLFSQIKSKATKVQGLKLKLNFEQHIISYKKLPRKISFLNTGRRTKKEQFILINFFLTAKIKKKKRCEKGCFFLIGKGLG